LATIARRTLLSAGLALSAASLLPAHGRAAGTDEAPDLSNAMITALSPREQRLFDFGWKFTFGHASDPTKDQGFGFGQSDFSKTGTFDFAKTGFDDRMWRTQNLPHDWAVELPFVDDDAGQGDSQLRSHGYKPIGRRYPESSVGWYRREFDVPAADAGRRIWIEFDGAFRDVLVFVNGCFIGRNDNGYAPFRFDLSDFLVYGGRNAIALRVDASFGDGWFYEGAGLYRHVWLLKTDPVHLGRWDSVVRSRLADDGAVLDLSATAINTASAPADARVRWTVIDAAGTVVATADGGARSLPAGGSAAFGATARLADAKLWSVETPNLYTALVTLEQDGVVRDGERVDFGVRSAVFTPDKGFVLNGQPVKIQGVCNHQDHAGVGAALPDRLQVFRVAVMQSMGCNAIRTSHNMPTPERVAACDRMGVMLMCETRQMSSSPEGLAQLDAMVRRYRNSPSVIIWSIGNEEFLLQDRMAEQGARIAAAMVRRCHELDPTRQVTAAVNAGNEKGVSDALDVIGFNYNQWLPDGFHKKYPNRPVMGSETSSAISTRGEYATDAKRNVMSSYDGVVSWGQTPEDWWKFQAEREWEAGGFAWTGFDYRGEPTPYGWPSINSQFGITDMCGFPKDYFYYYKAWWDKAPSLHVFPHWNWSGKEGRDIPVWVYSNLDEVELIVNGKSLGRQAMPRWGHLAWKATYAPGYIEARGFRNGRRVLSERRETTGPAASLHLSPDRATINADGEDISILRVEARDARGRPVPTAGDKITFTVTGAGALIGVGNGDPNCLESDKGPTRSLYNGLAQIIVQAGKQAGGIVVTATADGVGAARLELTAKPAKPRPAVA
jgi:beta-galactosidase